MAETFPARVTGTPARSERTRGDAVAAGEGDVRVARG